MTIRIVTDSTCDLPASIIREYNIAVVPLYINSGSLSFLDGVDISREDFYKKLPTFQNHPTTAVPSSQKFFATYQGLVDEGATQIISIHISSALSAVANVARIATQEFTSIPVTVLDGGQLSLGTGFLVETAAKLASAGHSITDILSTLENQIKRTHVFAALDTLEFLKRSGRMSQFMANFGNLLQIKPILTMYDGHPGTERVRTRERAMQRLIELLRMKGTLEKIAIVHTHAHDRVAELRARAAELLPQGEIMTEDITPVIGAHIGPGAFGFALVTK